ncbi:MAG: HypC/HybG/HupF family hydrogenase formation chaperone [Deltaproteobacteria bacterium]|nr:HypC/HybG/HupF family hydrogenase formation chaperone [Deltaproteobacteria bacterium]
MCLAVPMQLIEVDGRRGRVRGGGVELEVGLDLVGEVAPGDFVIVHAGFAIQQLSAEEAAESLEIFQRIEALLAEEDGRHD